MPANTGTKIFADKETNNWFKACIALSVTKEGLTNFVENTMKKVHAALGKCSSYEKAIISHHRFSGPSWKNTKRHYWKSNWWEIAKCFLPPQKGYADVSSVQESDFNAVINIIMNCTDFKNYLSSSWLSPPPPDPLCPLEKVRQIGRDLRHSANCKTTDSELQDYFQILTMLLADPLQNDRLPLTEFGNLIQEFKQAIERVKDAAEEDFSEKAKQSLEEGLKKIKEALKDGEQEIRNKIQQADNEITEKMNKATSQIEEMKLESVQTIYDRTEYCTRQIEQKIGDETKKAEQTITSQIDTLTKSSVKLIEDHTRDRMERIQQKIADKAGEDFERRVEDLRCRLVDHYRETVSYVPLSSLYPSLDKHVQDVYVSPKLHRIKIENDGRRTKQEQIFTYKDCFNRGDKLSRRIYLQGEPGSGKSTFAFKLVNEWCNIHLPSTESTKETTVFVDVETLKKFKFLFFISLRDSRHQKDVMQMIKTQLIDNICTEDEREEVKKLCLQIIKNDICLVIQDGLDEWPSDESLPSMTGIPKDNCIMLTTSRPWKLSDERIKNSQIDILLEVEGISDTEAFSERILRCLLEESMDIKKSVKQFNVFLESRNLESISSSPMLHALVLCTWVDDTAERLTGSSLCDLYTTLLDCLCKKATHDMSYFNKLNPPPVKNFEGSKYLKSNKAHIDSIAEAAFSFLFSNEKETSIVFSDVKLSDFLLPSAKEFALKSGLLTKRKSKKATDTTCRFVHKTFQEFLTAYHIANNADAVYDVVSDYLKRHSDSYLDISQMFIYLCGLNISAANKLSALMNEHGKYNQNLILSGYREAMANKNTQIHLHMSHFGFNYDNDAEELSHILALNTSRAQSLHIKLERTRVSICAQDALSTRCQKSGPVSLPACDDPGPSTLTRKDWVEFSSSSCCVVLDLSWCHNLERMFIRCNATVQPSALVGLNRLKDLWLFGGCKCRALDLSHHEHLESITLDDGVTLLPLSVNNYKSLKCIEIYTTYDGLDLSLFENLSSIAISNKVKLLPKRPLIQYKQKLTRIALYRFKLNSVDNEANQTWCLLNGEDLVQCADYTPVLLNIAYINLRQVTFSSNWLRSLLRTLLTLDHWVTCNLEKCIITSLDHEVKGRLPGSHIGSSAENAGSIPFQRINLQIETDLNKTCAIEVSNFWQNCLWETLHGLDVKNLSLRPPRVTQSFACWNREPQMLQSLESLSQLETLRFNLPKYIDLQLPPSLKHLIGSFYSLLPSQLRDLVNKLLTWTQSVECRLEFVCIDKITKFVSQKIPPEEYMSIKQTLEALENVKVKRFRIYEFALSTETWSVRDSVGVDDGGDDDDDDVGKLIQYIMNQLTALVAYQCEFRLNCVKNPDFTK
ncbi:uncharacterized protein LOC127871354 isoform X2 [Dreissena polymorpha]|uniref:uncharacterized protein LOC127871354 isoform X2 n=1 Tax=Dreissena polymorpha TaxID=45954 RepID=UPI002264A5BC|nr:uncharacterized protein LOC127871354 isoform X2 [Dreissena polymorpha]